MASYIVLLLAVPLVSALCNTFTPSPATYFTTYYTPQQASVAYVCNGPGSNSSFVLCAPGTCGVPVNGTFSLTGTTNLSLSTSDTISLFPIASEAMVGLGHESLSSTLCSTPSGAAVCLSRNQTAYATFAPLMTCVNGTLDACSGGSVVNGTAVTLCGNSTFASAQAVGVVNVTDIGSYQTYAAQTAKCSSGASALGSDRGMGLMLVALFVAIFWGW